MRAGPVPTILVTNDDGIHAAGIAPLEEALAGLADVYTVAPMCEMSAASHSISLRRPVPFEEAGERRWAVDGTPVDCVILAIHRLLPFLPDLLISGINSGGNLGRNVYYSGTVAAAVEGTLHGVDSMAVSLCGPPFDFALAASVAARLAGGVLEKRLPEGITLNVNIPARWAGGIRLSRMGRSAAEDPSRHRGIGSHVVDPSQLGSPADHRLTTHGAAWRPLILPGSDYEVVRDGCVAVTPLAIDRNDGNALESLASWLTPFTTDERG